ncbi:MAG: hypothetical protein QOE70_2543 [Chthoniobacter sp.]|jgi:hypothetical protein|nr:hypothetical protein [Chthoniobacter sp.]
MNRPPLSIEEQKDYVRRYVEGCEMASRLQEEAERAHTPEEKWATIEMLQEMVAQNQNRPPPEDPEEHGLVIQQRYFVKLYRRG